MNGDCIWNTGLCTSDSHQYIVLISVLQRNTEIISKCLASEWGMAIDDVTERYVPTVHSCFTSTVMYLRRHDEISIISLYGRRTVHQGKEMTFWGMVRLA